VATVTGQVIAEFIAPDGTRWIARKGADRGRLEVRAVVPPSRHVQYIEPLSPADLERWLSAIPPDQADEQDQTARDPEAWRCARCGATNEAPARWCAACAEAC
jgi:hypothetical protein